MHYGVTMFLTDQTMDPVSFAQAIEERGLYSCYIPEHTHIPTSRRTRPPSGDEELRDEYKRTLDPFVALSAAAAATNTVRLGTGICLVAQREPLVTAKAVATLDQVSGGRFVFGVGFGWNADEIEHHGVEMSQRRAIAREHVLAMRALWRSERASFAGEHVRFSESWSWPKPLQPGGPPILIGGAPGPMLFDHIADYADGWIPIGGRGVRAALADLKRACDARGRDAATLRIVPFGTIPEPGKLEYYASIGIDEVVLRVPGGRADVVLPVLDGYGELVASGRLP